MLKTDIYNYFKNEKYFKCEIKTASRWQQVIVKVPLLLFYEWPKTSLHACKLKKTLKFTQKIYLILPHF